MNKLTALFLILSVATVFADSHDDDKSYLSETLDLSGDGTFVVDLIVNEDKTAITLNMTLTGKTAARTGNGYWFGVGFNATGLSMLNVDYYTCKVVYNNRASDGCECFDWSYDGAATGFNWGEPQDFYNVTTNAVGSNTLDVWSCAITRNLDTGDSASNDKVLTVGSSEGLIWSYGAANTGNSASNLYGHLEHGHAGTNENGYLSITIPGKSSGVLRSMVSGLLCLTVLVATLMF